jgi:tubulin polyglutamylase TTLL5
MKPIGKSRGRGIKIVTSLSELNYTDNIVVQKYIANPMLIEGYKFDMRIYVLVTSFHPLEAFVYKEGFARLSTEKYSLDPVSIKNTFVHLTNFAINKNNVATNNMFAGGSKISLKALRDKITKMGHSFNNIWLQVHNIIVKSLLGCSVSVPSFPTAFELFGYDIMVDQNCNCYLIEINSSPSLERSYMIDEIVKQNLIDDILNIVDPPDFDKR